MCVPSWDALVGYTRDALWTHVTGLRSRRSAQGWPTRSPQGGGAGAFWCAGVDDPGRILNLQTGRMILDTAANRRRIDQGNKDLDYGGGDQPGDNIDITRFDQFICRQSDAYNHLYCVWRRMTSRTICSEGQSLSRHLQDQALAQEWVRAVVNGGGGLRFPLERVQAAIDNVNEDDYDDEKDLLDAIEEAYGGLFDGAGGQPAGGGGAPAGGGGAPAGGGGAPAGGGGAPAGGGGAPGGGEQSNLGMIHGLQTAEFSSLNGRLCTIRRYIEERDRFNVSVDGRSMNIKSDNLRHLSHVEAAAIEREEQPAGGGQSEQQPEQEPAGALDVGGNLWISNSCGQLFFFTVEDSESFQVDEEWNACYEGEVSVSDIVGNNHNSSSYAMFDGTVHDAGGEGSQRNIWFSSGVNLFYYKFDGDSADFEEFASENDILWDEWGGWDGVYREAIPFPDRLPKSP
eukprot:SAG22_NODE_1378_length_4547_cov_77.305755_1_plen_456_part_00